MPDRKAQPGLRLADRQQLAEYLGTSIPTVHRMVASGRLPQPFYVAPAAPRWDLNEVDRALEATRALPSEQKATRRAQRLELLGAGPGGFATVPMMTRG